LFTPAILLPRESAHWPASQLKAAIRHEQAHIERRDLWANFASNIVCAVYWFHPVAWMLQSRLRSEQEAACDDAVVNGGFDRATYAEALLAVARSSSDVPAFVAVVMSFAVLTPVRADNSV
jgi:beta-lactamase regulating signal transducer with metallopeptidase domain